MVICICQNVSEKDIAKAVCHAAAGASRHCRKTGSRPPAAVLRECAARETFSTEHHASRHEEAVAARGSRIAFYSAWSRQPCAAAPGGKPGSAAIVPQPSKNPIFTPAN